MALNYKDLVKEMEGKPLSQEELAYIDKLEIWIDEKLSEWAASWQVFSVELCYANFSINPFTDKPTEWNTSTKQKMYKELNKRYEDAEWTIREDIDDGLDGPNMSGSDYWVLDYLAK